MSAVNIEGTLHVDAFLTNFGQMYVQDEGNFVAAQAATLVQVTKPSDKYTKYPRSHFFRDDVEVRPLGGTPVQVGYKIESGNYNAEEYALEHFVDDRQRVAADAPINLDLNAARLLTQKHMIKRDRIWVQKFFKPGVWGTDVVGVPSGVSPGEILQFDDANSDPIGVIDRYKEVMAETTGMMPNTLVLGARVKRVIRNHPDVVDRVKYTQRGIITDEILASLFDLDNVVTARGVYNSAAEGATDNFTFIAPKDDMWLGYIDPVASLDSPTAISVFAWTGLIPGATNALGGVMERGRDNRAHSDYFQMRMAWDMHLVASELGVFFNGAVKASDTTS